jgi:hypothetical protein
MEGQEPEITIEELINKVMFLKEALKFYADFDHYKKGFIKHDEGHQARFALDQLKRIDDYNQLMINEAIKSVGEIEPDKHDIHDDLQDKMEEINNIINKYKDG